MTQHVLLLDFGSTYTKGTLINLSKEKVMSQGSVKTQNQSSLLNSYTKLKSQLATNLQQSQIDIDDILICSSAFGGFKMIAIGLTASLTTAAAKRVALGAGTRLLKTYSYNLSSENVEEINQLNPDVILLTGGTDGGNQQFILSSANQLTNLERDIPIIVAGNKQASSKVIEILSNKTFYLSENVMPKVNLLQADKTRLILRQIFFEKIIYSKGLGDVAKLSPLPIIPTPTAILNATNLLAQGHHLEPGWGDLAIIDVGGATTDVHSASKSISGMQDTLYEGLPEPYLKRTVEGDLGMRFSAVSLFETAGMTYFNHYSHRQLSEKETFASCQHREKQPDFIPTSVNDIAMEQVIAKIAVDVAVKRHVGSLRRERRPLHDTYYQQGKDLRPIKTLIGTGGVIVNSPAPKEILAASFQTHELILKPQNPTCYLDQHYLLSAFGLLAEHYPEIALRMMKTYLIPI